MEQRTAQQIATVWSFIRNHQDKVAKRMKAQYDRNRKDVSFQPGDLVLLSTKSHKLLMGHRKHQQKHVGPYIIRARTGVNAYELTGLPPNVPTAQNVRFLTLFHPSPRHFRTRPTPAANVPDFHDNEPEWEVESILDDRETRNQSSFLVKWANTPQQQWLPLRCMTHCHELLRDYFRERDREMPPRVRDFIEAEPEAEEEISNEDELADSNSDQMENSDSENEVVE